MIHVVASLHIKDGSVSEFLDIFNANVPAVLKEEGCIEYVPAIDVPTGLPAQDIDKNVVTIVEKWDSLEALKRHLGAPHMLEYRKKVEGLVEKVVLKILERA